jgi:hypothetical protein
MSYKFLSQGKDEGRMHLNYWARERSLILIDKFFPSMATPEQIEVQSQNDP